MVKLRENKEKTEHRAIEKIPLPARVYIPLIQHIGKPCDILEVKIGDPVFTGQKIAWAQAQVSAAVHASLSGKVSSIQNWPHPVLGRCKAVVIDSDDKDEIFVRNRELRTKGQIDNLSADEIRGIVFEAGIVGMGGASFPTHIKLNPSKPVDTLIINGAECEPYLTADTRLMIEKTKEIVEAIGLVVKCTGAKNIYIAVGDNKPEAIQAFRGAIRNTTVLPAGRQYTIRVLKSQYPQGGEKQLIKNILGKEFPRNKLPFDVGVVVHNVATVLAIYEAVYLNKPLYERLVTVTGSCLSQPKNILARIGTPIRDLIDFCAPLTEEPEKVIIGGPMMGIAQYTDQVPVIKSTTGLILLNKKEAALREEGFCIRCGACVRECPVGLMPCLINLAAEKEDWPQASFYGAADCIECGNCSYVCPANRMLVQSIKRAKLEVPKQ